MQKTACTYYAILILTDLQLRITAVKTVEATNAAWQQLPGKQLAVLFPSLPPALLQQWAAEAFAAGGAPLCFALAPAPAANWQVRAHVDGAGATSVLEWQGSIAGCPPGTAAVPSGNLLITDGADAHNAQLEAELLHLNQRFKLAASITADIIADWDVVADRYWRTNPDPDLSEAKHPARTMQERFERLHPSDKERFIHSLQQTLDSNALRWECEYRYQSCKDNNRYKVLNEKAVLIRDAAGRAIRMVSVIQDVTEKRRLQQGLREKELQVIAATIEGQERERNELAGELHDNVGQVLAMCKLFVDITSDTVQHEYLDKCREHLDRAIREIRSLSHRLSPQTLDRKGLPGAIRDLVDNINQTGMMQMHLTLCDDFTELALDKEVQLTAYRIIQENISNIVKHAQATASYLQVSLRDAALIIDIRDNGKGFDPAKVKDGIGLKNIHNRIKMAGGKVHLHTAPGKGCHVQVELPAAGALPLSRHA